VIREPLARARRQLFEDLREDPYLLYILLAATVLMTFWIWHRLPNFATRDERWRVVDSMEIVAFWIEDPTTTGIRDGIDFWRPYGATLYLYGLVTAPIIAFAAVTSGIGVFSGARGMRFAPDHFAHWQAVPGWVWFSSVLAARLVNAALAVASVYVLYRIGTLVRDRATGRLAAVMLSVTWAVVILAHEAGEDIPAMFCFLVVVYLALRYVQTGSLWTYLQACVIGGLAIAFKISAGLGAVLLGVAYLIRMRREYRDPDLTVSGRLPGVPELLALSGLAVGVPKLLLLSDIGVGVLGPLSPIFDVWVGTALLILAFALLLRRRADDRLHSGVPDWLPLSIPAMGPRLRRAVALARPRLLVFGATTGFVFVVLGFPHTFAVGPEIIVQRLTRGVGTKGSQHGWLVRPTHWWIARSYLNGLGWPMAVATVGGVLATIPRLRERSFESEGVTLLLSGVLVMVTIVSTWTYVRTHHILLLFPLVVLLTAVALQRLRAARPPVGRAVMAVLLVSTAVYAGVGTFGYATQPRDQSAAYLQENLGPNGTVETYSWDSQEAGVPHDATIYRPSYRTTGMEDMSRSRWLQNVERRCPDYIALNYQRAYIWLAPDNHSDLSSRWTGYGDAAYVHDLLSDDGEYLTKNAPYPYEVAESFGPEPFYIRNGGEPIDQTWNAVRAGIFPRTIQYGDPQDFGVYNHVTVLERTGECET
jgi:4-amino-4-deoxy-L-arabinose transferase-like glycosyltransferase